MRLGYIRRLLRTTIVSTAVECELHGLHRFPTPPCGPLLMNFQKQQPLESLAMRNRRFSEGLRTDATVIPEAQYHQLADHTLEDLLDRLEVYLEGLDLDEADIEYSQGVLTMKLGRLGTYVLNKQTPNRQIWMSSPVSGPVRYDFYKGSWMYHRDGHRMHERLERELEALTGSAPDLNPCSTCEKLGTCVNGSRCLN